MLTSSLKNKIMSLFKTNTTKDYSKPTHVKEMVHLKFVSELTLILDSPHKKH